MVTWRLKRALTFDLKYSSPQVIAIGGCMMLSGNGIRPSGSPLMPT